MQVGTISSVTFLARGRVEYLKHPVSDIDEGVAEVDWLPDELRSYMDQEGLTQGKVANKIGVSRSEISKILNHEKLVAEGGRMASDSVWEAVEHWLGRQ